MPRIFTTLLLTFLCSSVSILPCLSHAAVITFTTPSSTTPPITATVASTPAQRERGLMYIKKMPATHGMLFTWPQPTYGQFWMKNTYLPLDMIFISNGRVIYIEHNAQPLTQISRGPTVQSFTQVLEVNGGWSKKHHLTTGATAHIKP